MKLSIWWQIGEYYQYCENPNISDFQYRQIYITFALFFRFTAAHNDVQVFDSFFVTRLLMQDGPDLMCEWISRKKDMTLFDKKILLFPFHASNHWSLFAVVNPGRIKTAYTKTKEHGTEMPLLLCFDSLGSNTPHDIKSVARVIRMWLNRVWKIESTNSYEWENPFSRYTLKSFRVSGEFFFVAIWNCFRVAEQFAVPTQQNGYDCGVYVLKYIDSLTKLRGVQFSASDMTDHFKKKITDSNSMSFDHNDISDLRRRCFSLITRLKRRHDNLVIEAESTFVENMKCVNSSSQLSADANDNASVSPRATVSLSSDFSNYVADTSSDGESTSTSQSKISDLALSPGYVIHYRKRGDEEDNFKSAEIVSIVKEKGRVILSDGTQLDGSDYILCIAKVKIPSNGTLLPNPNKVWGSVDQFHLVSGSKRKKPTLAPAKQMSAVSPLNPALSDFLNFVPHVLSPRSKRNARYLRDGKGNTLGYGPTAVNPRRS